MKKNIEKIKEIILKVKAPFTDSNFYPRLYSLILKEKSLEKKSKNGFEVICEEEYGDLSRRCDVTKIQESTSLRNVLRTRAIANDLVSDKGEILIDELSQKIEILKKHLYSIGPGREFDAPRQELILQVLLKLKEDKELLTLLKTVSKPYFNKSADDIIRSTLDLAPNVTITDAHAKRAVLSALMCYLRQSVGSCFGTAPAIIIHDEQPKQFLKDIVELLGTSRLKRTYGGIEYSVPLSVNWGIGDLKKTIYILADSDLEKLDIWYSPGLIAALESASFFGPDFKTRDKIEKTKELVLLAISKLREANQKNYLLTNAEELISTILLAHFNLKNEDIEAYRLKERSSGKEGIMFQVVNVRPAGSNVSGQSVEKYLDQLEIAKTAFKILVDNALLKSWEFTLASFAENKAGFTTWNLYSSLGFRPEEKGGLGESLYEILKVKLDESNKKVHEFQEEYEQAYSHLKYLETRLRTSGESESQWIKGEYEAKRHEFNFLEEMRDKIHYKAKRFANLFDLLIDIFMQLFPQYFQEVYDAGMQDVAADQYDDSPAGFRLLFKHGRGNTAQWTRIYTPEEFIDSLVSFFTSTEQEIKLSQELEGLEQEFSEIITALVVKIRTPEFLESAFYRMAGAHKQHAIKDPLNHLDKIDKKPWAYVSGGNMGTLISAYYKRDQKPNEVSRWVESPTELFIFLSDSMKQLQLKIKEEYIKNPKKSMLMHSPTHAFLLKPGFLKFSEVWQSEIFTYTYIRDHLIVPSERFIRNMVLDEDMMDYFIDQLLENVEINFKVHVKTVLKPIYKTLSPIEFRAHLIDQLNRDRSLTYLGRKIFREEDVDSKLFSSLPFVHVNKLKDLVEDVLKEVCSKKTFDKAFFNEIMEAIYDTVKDVRVISADRLQDICKAVIALMCFNTTFDIDYHRLIAKTCREKGYCLNGSVIFADSNWVKDLFGFVINPGTGDLEFWRVDLNGRSGHPMPQWNQWLNGSRQDITWGIYNHPFEYSS